MDLFIVIAIVSAALFFTGRSFVKIYNGDKSCNCGGCGKDCSEGLKSDGLKADCRPDFPMADNK